MLSFRNTNTPTHTIDTRDGFVEAFLLGLDCGGNGIWLDTETKIHSAHFRKALSIPGRDQLYQIDQERVSFQPRIPFPIERSLDSIVRLMTANWRTRRSVAWNRVKIESTGRIVRKDGSPWIIKSRAQQILNELHLASTHIVEGYGNGGTRGREWWIQPKTTYFPSTNYILNGYHMPFDQWHLYSIEIPIHKNLGFSSEQLQMELKDSRKHWGYKIRREDDCLILGFSSEAEYSDFITYAISKCFDLHKSIAIDSNAYGQEGYKQWKQF